MVVLTAAQMAPYSGDYTNEQIPAPTTAPMMTSATAAPMAAYTSPYPAFTQQTTPIVPPPSLAAAAVPQNIAVVDAYGFQTPKLGELFLDTSSPDSLAPWLLLLESGKPFGLTEVDSRMHSSYSSANPDGVLPAWIDMDGSCIWGSYAVMRYICIKHGLSQDFYPTADANLCARVNMVLDWCGGVLAPHVAHMIDPAKHAEQDLADLLCGKPALDKDLAVLSDYLLRETPFIGGFKPCIADFAVALQLLMLYATDAPPAPKVREYLHKCANACDRWNDVSVGVRDFCMRRQHERTVRNQSIAQQKWEDEKRAELEEERAKQRQLEDTWRTHQANLERIYEEERRKIIDANNQHRQEEDQQWRAETSADQERAEKRFREEEQARRSNFEAEVRRFEEDLRRKREADFAAWNAQWEAEEAQFHAEENRKREEEERAQREAEERQAAEEARRAEEAAAAEAAKAAAAAAKPAAAAAPKVAAKTAAAKKASPKKK